MEKNDVALDEVLCWNRKDRVLRRGSKAPKLKHSKDLPLEPGSGGRAMNAVLTQVLLTVGLIIRVHLVIISWAPTYIIRFHILSL